MDNMQNIIVCTVTFNSSLLIKKTIDAVFSQSYPVFRMIIVDNNSTEEHKERLKAYQAQSDKIEIVWLNSNTGGAGGFHAAVEHAWNTYHPDWCWLMDDDAYPDERCLEILLQHKDSLDNVGFLAPVIYGIDNNKYQLYHARVKRGYVYKFNAVSDAFENLKDIENIDVDAFVGVLIPGKVIEECGLPRAEYFIEGDDTDYCFRITREHKGYLIKDAKMNHKDIAVSNGINPAGWWKQYYWFRNSILFPHYNLKGVHKAVSILHFIAFAYKERIKMAKDERYQGYRSFRWKILRKGLIDGVLKKGGPRLLPGDYKAQLAKLEKDMGK